MGNKQTEEAASSSTVEEFVTLAKREGIDIEKSIIVMFRLHEASLDKEQWASLKDHILHNDFPSVAPTQEKIMHIVSRESVKQEWKLSRETETPAFTGKIDEANDSENVSDPTPAEARVQQLKDMLKVESIAFFETVIQTVQGKRDFTEWMWNKTHSEGHHGITPADLKVMMNLLKQDGILPSHLLFASFQSGESECGGSNTEEEKIHTIIEEFGFGHGSLNEKEFKKLVDLILSLYESKVSQNGKVGKYVLKYKLGTGSVGVVRLGVDEKTDVKYAIKVILKGKCSDMSRIDNEIKAMMMLEHRHIVCLEEVFESTSSVFFVMELCVGGSLYELMDNTALSEPMARFFYAQIIDAVAYCHSQGICHRDLKLDNILLYDNKTIKITDFGHAGIFSEGWDIFQTALVGGITHIAPEQIQNVAYSGEKKDIWSLGVMLYEMITAHLPFDITDIPLLQEMVLKAQYTYPANCHPSPEIVHLISHMLVPDPAKRCTAAQVPKHPWMLKPETEIPDLSQFEFSVSTTESIQGLYERVVDDLKPSGVFALYESGTNPSSPVKCHIPSVGLKFSFFIEPKSESSSSNSASASKNDPVCPSYQIIFKRKHGEPHELLLVRSAIKKKLIFSSQRKRRSRNGRSPILSSSTSRKKKISSAKTSPSPSIARKHISKDEHRGREREKSPRGQPPNSGRPSRTFSQPRVDSSDEDSEEGLVEFKKAQSASMVDEATNLVAEFEMSFRQLKKTKYRSNRPNVLIAGSTGVGKSAIINRIFGRTIATVGVGKPCTEGFKKYSSKDIHVVIYDSQGTIYGEGEETWLEDTKTFLAKHTITPGGNISHAIHVIWYVIDASTGRVEPKQIRTFVKMFPQVPILILLNKIDKSSVQETEGIMKVLEGLEIPTLAGIFKTMGEKSVPVTKTPSYSNCTECGSDDIVLRKKTNTIECCECGKKTSLSCGETKDELPQLLAKTTEVLPNVTKYAFVASQTLSFALKEEKAHKIILQFWDQFPSSRTVKKLLRMTTSMLAELSLLWEFKLYGKEYAQMISNQFVAAFTWKDTLNLWMQKKHNARRAQATSLGILWNHCLEKFMTRLVGDWLKSSESEDPEGKATALHTESFSIFTEENALALKDSILSLGLPTVLQTPIDALLQQNSTNS
eukprot:TRINITY_DN6836_c0_g2_i1.p1 TRINITY_DN6836_c0_g2~~TRINITY_DN6836_c0_g2_i1.p1  ORF type:complete len:1147 (-),score=237.16 TRINITY_DN6836_c0_g2_i1:39-3479(-)